LLKKNYIIKIIILSTIKKEVDNIKKDVECPNCKKEGTISATYIPNDYEFKCKCGFNFPLDYNERKEGYIDQLLKEFNLKKELNINLRKKIFLCHYEGLKSKLIIVDKKEEAYKVFKKEVKKHTIFNKNKIEIENVDVIDNPNSYTWRNYRILLQKCGEEL
jgi:hypothetical protein